MQSALANDQQSPQFTFSTTAASNYIFRGISQTANNPAVFGTAQVSYDKFYAGLGGENVYFHNSTKAEYDLSAGWKPILNGFDFDLGTIRYGYIDQPGHPSIDTVEFKGAVTHALGKATLGTAIFYTPNYFGTDGDGVYVQGNAAYQLTDQLSASGAVGRQNISAGNDYTTWNLGGGYAITKNIGIDLRYHDTDEHQLGNRYASHYVASVTASF